MPELEIVKSTHWVTENVMQNQLSNIISAGKKDKDGKYIDFTKIKGDYKLTLSGENWWITLAKKNSKGEYENIIDDCLVNVNKKQSALVGNIFLGLEPKEVWSKATQEAYYSWYKKQPVFGPNERNFDFFVPSRNIPAEITRGLNDLVRAKVTGEPKKITSKDGKYQVELVQDSRGDKWANLFEKDGKGNWAKVGFVGSNSEREAKMDSDDLTRIAQIILGRKPTGIYTSDLDLAVKKAGIVEGYDGTTTQPGYQYANYFLYNSGLNSKQQLEFATRMLGLAPDAKVKIDADESSISVNGDVRTDDFIRAVMEFQRSHKIQVDGLVGKATVKAMVGEIKGEVKKAQDSLKAAKADAEKEAAKGVLDSLKEANKNLRMWSVSTHKDTLALVPIHSDSTTVK